MIKDTCSLSIFHLHSALRQSRLAAQVESFSQGSDLVFNWATVSKQFCRWSKTTVWGYINTVYPQRKKVILYGDWQSTLGKKSHKTLHADVFCFSCTGESWHLFAFFASVSWGQWSPGPNFTSGLGLDTALRFKGGGTGSSLSWCLNGSCIY